MPMREEHQSDPRRAGLTRRYHTWPTIREQTVAEHSWQVARVLLAIWPDAPRHLIIHCLTHDLGEQRAGDLPYPVKKMSPDLALAHSLIERQALLDMVRPWGVPMPILLSDLEKKAFKLAEFIEMAEWAWNEVNMGNRYATLVHERCHHGLSERLSELRTLGVEGDHIADTADSYWSRRTNLETQVHAE